LGSAEVISAVIKAHASDPKARYERYLSAFEACGMDALWKVRPKERLRRQDLEASLADKTGVPLTFTAVP
jgi:hypothetical protein